MTKMKNTAEMRSFLLDRMEALASGKESVTQSQAVAALAKQVNATLALELQATRILSEGAPHSPLKIK